MDKRVFQNPERCKNAGVPIERDWRELSDLVLERFIRAGFTRQAILLARPNAIVRAQIHDPEIVSLIETTRSIDPA